MVLCTLDNMNATVTNTTNTTMHIFYCPIAEFAMADDGELGNCIVKIDVDYSGQNTYLLANVDSLADCMDICREKDIKYFVWVKTVAVCICKAVVSNYKNQDRCCDSG